MPPEPLPWDRKERKHDRSEVLLGGGVGGGGGFVGGGGGGGGGGPRWREPPQHHHYGSSRWVSDFRSRGHPGHGKQGGWNPCPEESGHGFMPSRSNEKIVEDESCRQSGSRGDGKYCRNGSRENRSFSQRGWRVGNSYEAASPNGPGRQNDATNDQRSVDVILPYSSSHPHSENVDSSHSRDQHNKSGAVSGVASTGQRFERENSLGSTEWKPLKWTRSGSLSSRGSFSHSSSSKSIGGDSNETKLELQPRNSPVQSPSGDATACVTSAAPSEETTSRKKPRLGWGEGLAKYEKKKVEGPEDSAVKVEASTSGDSVEPGHSHHLNLADKSQKVVFMDCPSPATPSSVACSSSPGLEEKQFVKATSIDQDVCNLSASPSIVSQNHSEGFSFLLENLDLAKLSNLNSSINELVESYDPNSDAGFMRSTALNKLLVWKSDISKALEKTEAEIDSLENELKSLISEPENNRVVPSASCSPPKEGNSIAQEDRSTKIATGPAPLQVVISADMIGTGGPNLQDDEQSEMNVEDIDSPGSATSKFVEVQCDKDAAPDDATKQVGGLLISDDSKPSSLEVRVCSFREEKACDAPSSGESSHPINSSGYVSDVSLNCREDALYNLIYSANKDSANRAFEVFNRLLPARECSFDFSRAVSVSSLCIDPTVKGRFYRRKHFQQFKEKIIALKFRVFKHLWKEDIRMLSVRKLRAKSQKKCDISLRPVQIGHQKHRLTIRSRVSTVENLSLAPSSELLKFASRLLSDTRVKVYRNTLRMPALILDQKEKTMSRFISKNGLVEDPCAVEKERSLINPWTADEREIFIDKLATFGKDFRKIASFLDHKTTADCVEFYYKNHKSDCFERTKRKSDFSKQVKSCSANTYLVASGNRWNREANSASLDILGAASAIVANVQDGVESHQKGPSKYTVRVASERKTSRHNELERSISLDVCHSERETVAADVLAGICGSISSEAMSSCITSSVDQGYQEWKYQKVGSSTRLPLTPEVTQCSDEETCSDESCGEMDPTDWTDEEKSIFIDAVSAYGKDFAMISRRVRTKSRDQCKIFFSKARKRLGLDKIHSTPCNLARKDANGGGSDADDAGGIMKSGLLMYDEKSSLNLEEISYPGAKGGIPKPDMNSSDDKDEGVELDSVDTETLSKNLVQGNSHVDKEDVEFNRDCEIQNDACIEITQGDENTVTLSQEGVQIVGDATDSGVPDRPCAEKVPDKHLGDEVKGVVFSPEQGVEDREVEIGEGSKALLESGSECKPDVNFLENNISVPRELIPQPSNADKLSDLDLEKESNGQSKNATQTAERPLPGTSLLAHAKSCQIFGSYPLGASATKENGDSGCKKPVSLRGIQKLDRNLHADSDSTAACFLQKCNSTKHCGSTSDHPIPSKKQSGNSSSNVEKPCRNGDVKLFGQILSKQCSRQNPSSNAQQREGGIQHAKFDNYPFKPSHSVDRNSVSVKFERNNFLGSEKHPVRSIGFWDGNRIQTGFSSLPDSAILLAKYPAAFGNYAMPSAKTEQPPLQGVVKTTELNLNGVPVFPSRDMTSNIGVAADYHQVYLNRDVHPFSIDMSHRKDVLFSEMQRRNGFDGSSGLPQQTRGMAGINVVGRGGILMGGQCNGVSDPVAAIKMHYAKAEGFSGQASTIREDDTWRGKGGISR